MAKKLKTINLALQGGGSHGALIWGILDKLLEDGRVVFDSISATSAGAMNAAVLVNGLALGGKEQARQSLYQFWRAVSETSKLYGPIKSLPWEVFFEVKPEYSLSYVAFNLINKLFSPYESNPANINPLREILTQFIDEDLIRSTKATKLFVSATNVKTGKIKVFNNSEITINALLASAALPFIFQAVEIDNEFYWDGGYLGNPAIFPLIYNSKCKDILILHINPICRDSVPKTANTILNRLNEITFNSSLMREMRAIAFVTDLLDKGWIKDEYKSQLNRLFLHAIRADLTMESYSVVSKLDANWLFIKSLFEKGRQEGELWLEKNMRHIGKKSTINLSQYL